MATTTNKQDSEMIKHLQIQVANAFVLYLNYKHYHWQTYGPLFRDLHVLFDEFATEVYGTVDILAERLRVLGKNPVASIEEFKRTAEIKSAETGTDMRGMISEAGQNAKIVIDHMHKSIECADKVSDPGTADMLTKFIQIYEKHEWWLREIQAQNDGLTN